MSFYENGLKYYNILCYNYIIIKMLLVGMYFNNLKVNEYVLLNNLIGLLGSRYYYLIYLLK